MASVTFKNVTKKFGLNEVLHDVSLQIADQEFLVLVGPSGCGKSTLLRMLAGLEETTEGEIHIGDRLVNHLPPRSREIAMVFQDYALYPHMTVAENMSFGLRLKGIDLGEIDRRVLKAANILHIEPLLRRTPRQLSGGQRQRVAIGRAIVREPKVFLFDEPLSNLDAKLREEMRIEIAKLHQKLATTIIYVTHDQVEAMTLASRIAVVNAGQIQQVGAPTEVFGRPENVFVAGFIGSPTMNFIEGELARAGGGLRFKTAGVDVPVMGGPAGGPPSSLDRSGTPAVLGVRPEAIHIDRGDAPADGAVPAEVEVVELLGYRKNVHLKVGAAGAKVLASVGAAEGSEPGEKVSLRFDPAGLHLFEKATGRRIR
ncbi:MAG: sn-glycerol-3-phosphate ABC transporter ATP-binding protein UgpC [Elusimicrobia bacterium]|nr:sn-glycerol-3-phosphate ABC transporter ATP-binding protein UgpC [Elusimicrobiota bacterium]